MKHNSILKRIVHVSIEYFLYIKNLTLTLNKMNDQNTDWGMIVIYTTVQVSSHSSEQ